MRIIKPSRIREYAKKYADAATSLERWLKEVKRAEWQNVLEVRRLYPSADVLKVASGSPVTVFNIGGNKYRLIVAFHYNRQIVFILLFLTHAEYDKEKWKEQL